MHCMSNVCTHRGNLMVYEPCKLNQLRCKYHGRLFSLDGTFISMPEFKEVEDFQPVPITCIALRYFNGANFLFTVFIQMLPAKLFKEMINQVGWLPMHNSEYRSDLSKDYIVKRTGLYTGKLSRRLYSPVVHAGLNAVLDF